MSAPTASFRSSTPPRRSPPGGFRLGLAVLASGIGSILNAQPAPLVLTPKIDAIGAYSLVERFPVIAGNPGALSALDSQASRRFTGVGADAAPLTFDLSLADPAWGVGPAAMLLRIDRVSAAGAGMRITVGGQSFGVLWQNASTWIVGQTFRIPVPVDADELILEGTSGVVVMDWVQFTTGTRADTLFTNAITLMANQTRTFSTTGSGDTLPPPLDRAALDALLPAPGSPEHHLRPYSTSPYSIGLRLEDNWPTLWLTLAQTEAAAAEITRKIRTRPWAASYWQELIDEAETVIATPPHFPFERVGWRHDFYARTTGEHLFYDPASGNAYLDPSTGVFEYSAAQRQAWVLLSHERTLRIMRSLGLLYAVTGDERYAAWVAEGMRRTADYITHAIASGWERSSFGGKAVWYQPLYDASVVLAVANSYALTRESPAYSTADHERIRTGIFENRVAEQMSFLQGVTGLQNMAAYASAAVAVSGELYGRQDWIAFGTGAEFGFTRWLQNNVPVSGDGTFDGWWSEETTFYHFYSLAPLITLFELTETLSAEHEALFRKMFEAPLHLADRDLNLHLMGDLASPENFSLIDMRMFYEYAAGRISAADYGPVLAAIYARGGIPRGGLPALLFGPDELPAPGGLPTGSSLLPVSSFGTFRDFARSLEVGFRGGLFKGGHDHPDRLSIFLTAEGRAIAPDLGEPGYGLRTQTGDYYRRTISHNTLFVDEQEIRGSATLDWRAEQFPARAKGVIANSNYSRFERTVFFDPPFIVLIDQGSSATDSARRYGWVFHAYGQLEFDTIVPQAANAANPPWGMPVLPTTNGYEMLTQRKAATGTGSVSGRWKMDDGRRLNFVIASDGAFELTTARSAGNPIPRDRGAIVLRAPGVSRKFYTVLEMGRGERLLSGMSNVSANGMTVHLTDGSTRVYDWSVNRRQSYADWLNACGYGSRPEADRAPTADPENRGMANLLRFAFGDGVGVDPAALHPTPRCVVDESGADRLALTFRRNRRAEGVRYQLETSSSLSDWAAVPLPEATMESASGNGDVETVQLLGPARTADEPTQFLRVKVEQE